MTPTPDSPRCTPVADSGLLVEFGTEIGDSAHDAVIRLDAALADDQIAGMTEVVPAMVNLLVVFDPVVTDHGAVESAVRRRTGGDAGQRPSSQRRVVEVCYDESVAPDLADVASACGVTVDEVIASHLAGDYRVFMFGFAPGYAYLAGVPDEIHVPRKPSAVRGVAAGSVIIAGPQCLVTTLTMPTGWSVIGRSPTRILLDDPDRPFLVDVGDEVVFERIDLATLGAGSTGRSGG